MGEGAGTPAPRTRYRYGDRDETATAGHVEQCRQWRRSIADAAFPPRAREVLLGLVGDGVSLPAAAAEVGVSVGEVYARARWDEAFGAALDVAAEALCLFVGGAACGRPAGYRAGCRGTACRRWRRDQSRAERAAGG